MNRVRIIKFRAWHTKANKMFSAEEMGEDQLMILPDGRGFINVHGGDTALSILHPEMIPMQFTGLHDKNGKEIYESDIFRLEESDDNGDIVIYLVITWVKEWCMFATLRTDEYSDYLKKGIEALDEPMFWTYTLEDTDNHKYFLCGNVYANPDLLS